MTNKITSILFMFLLLSCGDNAPAIEESLPNTDEYIIFGHFYGFCGGEECIEIFKLTKTELYEDSNDTYPSSEAIYSPDFVKVAQSKFNKLNDLEINIPDALLNETEKVIGAPDAADGGGIYLQLSDGQFWLLDMNEGYLPEYLHPLRKQVRSAIALIND